MERTDLFDQLCQEAVRVRTHIWQHHQERDMEPRVAFVNREGGVFEPPFPTVDPPRAIHQMFELGRTLIDGFMDDLDAFYVIADTHLYTGESIDDVPDNIEHDFKTNPATKVTEALNLIAAFDDRCGGCDLMVSAIPYRLTDGGVLEFGERMSLPESVEGEIIAVIRDEFRKEAL